MIVEGFEMHLYCDGPCRKSGEYSGNRGEFSGYNKRDTRRAAKRAGWKIRGRTVLCPECAASRTEASK